MTNLEKNKKVLKESLTILSEMGYKPYYYDENEIQVDCLINGLDFAIYCDDTGESDTFGLGIIYELIDEHSDEEIDKIMEAFELADVPFKYLHYFEDENSFHVETDILLDEFSKDVLIEIVNAINSEDNILNTIRNISYIWEEK